MKNKGFSSPDDPLDAPEEFAAPLRGNAQGKQATLWGMVLMVVLACPCGSGFAAPDLQQSSVLAVFPESGNAPAPDEATCSFDYQPSGSVWTPGLDEKLVFLADIKSAKWQLGIGKGGQIYSLRGPYGESIPPQRVASPWNDEVWQLVATSEELAVPIQNYQVANQASWSSVYPLLYFVHQSGIYIEGDGYDGGTASAPFYSPCLRKRWNPKTRTLELVNWMQQARSPCVWKSELLVYTAYRDIGGGALEVTQILHNFGDLPVDYISSPWGGVRKSSLPETIVSKSDGSWEKVEGVWSWHENKERKLPESGGWAAWVGDAKDDNSPALALVFGVRNVASQKKNAPAPNIPHRVEGSRLFLWGTSGDGALRDYEVAEQATKVMVARGDSLAIRWYLVSGNFSEVRATAAKLVDSALIERITFQADAVQSVWVSDGKINTSGEGARWGGFAAYPAEGCVPVFLVRDKKTGVQTVTADIYAFSPTTAFPNPLPENHSAHALYQNRVSYAQHTADVVYEDLLGFAFKDATDGLATKPIEVPKGVRLHDSAKGLRMLP